MLGDHGPSASVMPGDHKPSVADFAEAVGSLERRLGRPPDECEIARELRWMQSWRELIALGQAAKAAGLVRVFFEKSFGGRRYGRR